MERIIDTLFEVLDTSTGEQVTYNKVLLYKDDTTMNDAKCDGVIYRKLITNGVTEYFKRNYTGYINVKWFGAKGDGITDDSASFLKAINTGYSIQIPYGKYLVNTVLILTNVNGIIFNAEEGTEIFTNINYQIIEFRNCSNLTFNNIKFSTYRPTGSTNTFGILYCNNADLKYIYFNSCRFTAPTASVNAVKFINEGAFITDTIDFYKCIFEQVGRMGIEMQNHNYTPPTVRYKNISARECQFINTGVSGYGMGISVSGMGSGLTCENNVFDNYKYAGIEIVGCSNNIIANNKFTNPKTLSSAMNMSGQDRMYNTFIKGNIVEDADTDVSRFYNAENIVFENNVFNTQRYIAFRDSANVRWEGGFATTNNIYVIYIESLNSISKNYKFFNATLNKITGTSSLFSIIRTAGIDTIDVKLYNCILTKDSTGGYLSAINSAEVPTVYNCTQSASDTEVKILQSNSTALTTGTLSNTTLEIDLSRNLFQNFTDITDAYVTPLVFTIVNSTPGYKASIYFRNNSTTARRISINNASAFIIGNTMLPAGARGVLNIYCYGGVTVYSLDTNNDTIYDSTITASRTSAQLNTLYPSVVAGQKVFATGINQVYEKISTSGGGIWKQTFVYEAGSPNTGNTPVTITAVDQQAVVNTKYIANNAALVTITLPLEANAIIGDQVLIRGRGAGLWRLAQNASQVIHTATGDTTNGTGGSLTATNRYDNLVVEKITTNEWSVISSTGTLTKV